MTIPSLLRPYSAKAIIEHEWDADHLNIFVTFRFAMETTSDPLAEPVVHDVMPPLNLWLCEVDDVLKPITVSAWQDAWTLLLTVPDIVVLPDRVTLEYAGPHKDLRITWEKQWEPWGPILSDDIGKRICFVDRGDHTAHDFTTAFFTTDGAWYDIDLSSIVPEGAKAVTFSLRIKTSGVGLAAEFRTKGNIKSFNMAGINPQVGGITHIADLIVPLKADRIIEYSMFGFGLQTCHFNVKGWWF